MGRWGRNYLETNPFKRGLKFTEILKEKTKLYNMGLRGSSSIWEAEGVDD